MRVYYVHWDEAEAKQRARVLEERGHEVEVHWDTGTHAKLKAPLPDVLVISLDRLPSHGREIAEWLWEAKKRQHIPIVFEGGAGGKIEVTRAKFPRARFCPTGGVARVLEEIAKEM